MVKVFLDDRINDDGATRETLLASLLDSPGVVDAVYYSKADAFDEALEVFKNNPSVLRVMEENPGIVPASFRILVSSEAAATELAATAENAPGVTEARVVASFSGYLAEYGGEAVVYTRIASLEDCGVLQAEFDTAANNFDRTGDRWNIGYMEAANDLIEALGCP